MCVCVSECKRPVCLLLCRAPGVTSIQLQNPGETRYRLLFPIVHSEKIDLSPVRPSAQLKNKKPMDHTHWSLLD
jgi:hypothetical protein